jgi:ribosomal protein S18 acetylase RimI-like enzyme/N-acetylglutamate synthase-like GNAT family acetyltransferase
MSVPKMTPCPPPSTNAVIRSVQYRDLDAIEQLCTEASLEEHYNSSKDLGRQLPRIRQWYAPLKVLSLFPNPCKYEFCVMVAEQEQQVRGMIQVSPFNRTRSTWRVERVLVSPEAQLSGSEPATSEIGSQLLRHCFKAIVEAHTWLLEVNIHEKSELALYRQNGFQPLAELTYWAIAPELLQKLAEHEPDLPNLLPVSNADAQLLYQLDTVAMPPLLRQVFDRQIHDFKTSFIGAFFTNMKQWLNHTSSLSGYVFEPQRKAAIGYFSLQLCRQGSQPHKAQLTVHPAYTWLYPELLSKMARLAQEVSSQPLYLASADYQPEREEYFEQLGAERVEHTLLMSRSVWHKVRETKPLSLEALQLSEMLQSLQPARKPVASRLEWLKPRSLKAQSPLSEASSASAPPPNAIAEEAAPELPNAHQNGHQC